jgi:hypothetical protein
MLEGWIWGVLIQIPASTVSHVISCFFLKIMQLKLHNIGYV